MDWMKLICKKELLNIKENIVIAVSMYDQLRRMLKLKWCIVCSNTIINNNFQCMKPTASDPNYLFTNIQRHTSFGLRQTWTGNNTLTIGNLFLTQLCREKCIFLMTKILINLMIGNLLAQKLFSVQNNLFFRHHKCTHFLCFVGQTIEMSQAMTHTPKKY